MKIRHRVPTHLIKATDAITADYQAEIDRTMTKAETAWNRAQKRLEAAQSRLARVALKPARTAAQKRQIRDLGQLVELRREELANLHRVMVATGAPSTSRGRKSHRHVSTGEVI